MGWGLGLLRNSAAVKSLIKRLNLPLEVTDDRIQEHLQEPGKAPPPSPYTQAYPAQGFFTGVRSRVVISQPAAVVYESLSHDLHNVFTPMTECDDTVEADDGAGGQTLFRIVRIPFKVMFVAGNLKLRLRVEQDSRTGQISFVSLKEGRLISHMVATFHISPAQGADGETHCLVELDAKVAIMPMFGRLAPGVFKDAVKGVMVHKMDCCMLDLIAYHSPQQPDRRSLQQKRRSFAAERRKGASGRSSRDFGRRRSLSQWRRSLSRKPSSDVTQTQLAVVAAGAAGAAGTAGVDPTDVVQVKARRAAEAVQPIPDDPVRAGRASSGVQQPESGQPQPGAADFHTPRSSLDAGAPAETNQQMAQAPPQPPQPSQPPRQQSGMVDRADSASSFHTPRTSLEAPNVPAPAALDPPAAVSVEAPAAAESVGKGGQPPGLTADQPVSLPLSWPSSTHSSGRSSMLISPFAAVSGGVIEPRTPPHAGPAEDGCVGAHTGEAAQQPCGASQAVDLNDSAQCLAHSRRLVPSQQHRADSSPRKVPDSPIQGAANKPGHRSMARRGLHKVNKRVRGLF